jgi:holo-[acyl-carrier protein] synthase
VTGAGRPPGTGDNRRGSGGGRGASSGGRSGLGGEESGVESVAGSSVEQPPETTELGIDIIGVSRIAASLARFGDRFTKRVLTPAEAAYVRNRPETLAGRWAAKEAVSKVLGLGVRGIGWRDIEVERLPTGQPSIRLHGRAARRATQLGMGRIAVSISHEAEFAVAVAYGVRTAGGRFLLPPDIEERIGEREASLLRRLERLRGLAREAATAEAKLVATEAAGPAGAAATKASEEQAGA